MSLCRAARLCFRDFSILQTSEGTFSRLLFLMAFTGLGITWLAGSQSELRGTTPVLINEPMTKVATTDDSARYLTFVSTDKPVYRPSEKLYVRTVVLEHLSNKPLPADRTNSPVTVEIKGPKGDLVASGFSMITDGTAGFSWDIPEGQTGGEYTVLVGHSESGTAPAERKFDIRAYRAPRLKSQIKFVRDGYGSGDEVVAMLNVERAEGGIPENANVTVTARVDGAEIFRGTTTVDASGNCTARFPLPEKMERGEGTVAMTIEDGGVIETATKTIPILLQTIDLTFYPEGGDLLTGSENRIYFEAFTPAGKPADLAGAVFDSGGNEVAQFRSEHEGRGRFELTPVAGQKYVVKISEPSGINSSYALPKIENTGATIRCSTDTFEADESIRVQVNCLPADRDVTVTLAKHEKVLGTVNPEIKTGNAAREATFKLTADDPAGVLIATVFDADGKPLAERLIYRRPSKSVQIRITPDMSTYTPGGTAHLSIETTDENGEPISAVVGITVTDDSVLEMIERREQAPQLPVMVLLEADVRELADADVYLDPENPQAPLAVDLLLGTQGWRRFANLNSDQFVKSSATPLRALAGQAQPMSGAFDDHEKLFFKGEIAENAPAPPQGDMPEIPGEDVPADHVNAENAPEAEEHADLELADQAMPAGRADANKNALLLQMGAREMDGDFAGGRGMGLGGPGGRGNSFDIVRVYAHQVRAGRQPGQRIDFAETLYWNAGIRTDKSGKAGFDFDLSDAVTGFRVLAEAFNDAGDLGSVATNIESVEPFYLEPLLPLEVSSGDRIRLPIGFVNATTNDFGNVGVSLTAGDALTILNSPDAFALGNDQRIRKIVDVTVGQHNGQVEFSILGTAGEYSDNVTRTLTIRPQGFPISFGAGGLLAADSTATHEVEIPESLIEASLECRVAIYPTPLASMTDALEALIQQPCGCFEQTSSSVYPLIMAQQYFQSHQGVDPELIERSSQILADGYQRLTSFESPSHGFEWFGADPGHDALTAYGLMEFTDMSTVRHVDESMLTRTREWLLSQRDGKGGYERKTNTLHTWLAEPELSNTYNTWALLEAGVDADLSTEVEWIRKTATVSENTYVIALGANVLLLSGDSEGADPLLDKLSGLQNEDGSLRGATQSVVGSGGEALDVETTALAVQAWLKNPRYAYNVEKSIKFLAETCKAGRFGSTQSTVLALRAIIAYDNSRARPKSAGSLQLIVDGKKVGQPVSFDEETQGAIELPGFAELLAPGKHTIKVIMADGSEMPYSVAVNYNCLTPDSAADCDVQLDVSLANQSLEEGSTTEANVSVVNHSEKEVPNPIAIIGIPGGLEVRHDQLKELVAAGSIAAYEVRGREVVLYWRILESKQKVEVPLSLLAAVPGTYSGPASRTYLYYTDELKHWVESMSVEIQPKGGQ